MSDPQRTGAYQPEAPTLAPAHAADVADHSQQIGRYRVERILGEGGFGLVYLAHDDQLQRLVAIKVPHRERIGNPEDAQAYLAEARILASLDHPNIVPVHDVGRSDDGLCFVVSKLIEGHDLATVIKDARLSFMESAELVRAVAEALHYAHRKGLVHRDVKPGNILIGKSGIPYLADFGLALKEADYGKGGGICGTPAYMSPEQANGEGHRVDGRSDIFSLGVVLYELLTGRRPFRGETAEVLIQIVADEPRPPRQIDDAIPKELERICLKAMSKRASERYTTAKDISDDLRQFLAGATDLEKPAMIGVAKVATPTDSPTTYDQQAVKIVPKGLRSFDAGDTDFFLELLPGPRDREGLPESIRFWKSRIEATEADSTFAVGLIYGPSGCGKSSLVKAGLLPRLAKSVTVVYVEATGEETEARLVKGLRRQVKGMPDNLGLVESLVALRQGKFPGSGQKVLLVVDQFEQWLHARRNEERTELVKALRQCDGGRLQAIVMVRDDFWLAVSRFMQALEVRVLEGENSRLVDLFDPRHAKKVLTAFGRAFGALPEGQGSKEQDAFLDQAIAGLAQEGKVVSVRLALFAEMVKDKAWTLASLKAVGGTEGTGVSFLEEMFGAITAPPERRYHQKAARAVLKALLPEAGSDIKGHMRSQRELLEVSGYSSRPKEFSELLHILDSELRLITPTDPEGRENADPSTVQAGTRYYQLTHDYLVPSLRDWLTRKQKETRRGRAELLLADRAAVWNARPENRQLPSLVQWLQIRWHTRKRNWTLPQRKMMQKVGRFHAVRSLVLAVVLLVLLAVGLMIRSGVVEQQKRNHAEGLVQSLLNADTAQVPAIIDQMAEYRKWVDPLLKVENQNAQEKSRQKLHTSLALLPGDPAQVLYLYDRLLDAESAEVPVIRDFLAPHKDELVVKLWAVVESPEKDKESQRLRAAAALAKYDPDSEQWAQVQEAVVNDLVNVPALHLGIWMSALRDVRTKLLPQLSVVFRNSKQRETERSLATDILADYAADNPHELANLLMDAEEKQFLVIYAKLKEQAEQGVPLLTAEIDKKLPSELASADKERENLAKRQANAAVALLRMYQPEKVWSLLKLSPDPRVRSYLIHRLSPMGADAQTIIKRFDDEPDITIKRALILSLGEFNEKELPAASRTSLLPKLRTIHLTDADPGLHAAAEWLLRTWKETDWLKQVNEQGANDKEQREKRLEGIEQVVKKDQEKAPPQWYVNGQGQTMVVIAGPVEFVMGSPPTEAGRESRENQHKMRIGRTFALAAKSVTLAEYQRFDAGYGGETQQWSPTGDCPVLGISWFHAAAYCNWLSKQEGLPESEWCYEPLRDANALPLLAASSVGLSGSPLGPVLAVCGLYPGLMDPEYKVGMKLAANYLKRSGYRLPTEAEMEFATRAGSVTSRYYGETEELLPNYAWYNKNGQDRAWPVGSKKPNDLGFFDVQGNVFTWCQERFQAYPNSREKEVSDDDEDALTITLENRGLRGGSFGVQASIVRSAFRQGVVPTYRSDGDVGLRPARTFPLGSPTGRK